MFGVVSMDMNFYLCNGMYGHKLLPFTQIKYKIQLIVLAWIIYVMVGCKQISHSRKLSN